MAADLPARDAGVADLPPEKSERELKKEALYEFFAARCERSKACYEDAFIYRYRNIETCVQLTAKWPFFEREVEAIDTDPEDILECAAMWDREPCLNVYAEHRRLPGDCKIKGARATGELCWHDFVCETGLCNQAVHDSGEQLCDSRCIEHLEEGDDCEQTQCPRDMYCRLGNCVRRREIGEACESLNKSCRINLNCLDGTCVPAAAEGETCGFGQTCVAQNGLECERVETGKDEFVCVRLTEETRLQEYDSCAFQSSKCVLGLVCGSRRLCWQPALEGEECNNFRDCAQGFTCLDGTCQIQTPENSCGRSSNEDSGS